MKQTLITFFESDDGAVTVDWVVLTAAIVGLAFIILGPFVLSVSSKGQMIGDAVGTLETGLGD